MVFSGIAGAIVAACGAGAPTLLSTSILTLPGYIGKGFAGFCIACAIAYFGSAIVTFLFGFSDDMILDNTPEEAEAPESKDEELVAPVNGTMIPLSDVKDDAFSSELLGKGFAMIPADGKVCAPCDGVISAVYETGHAVGITTANGAEILIHIGMDTVSLNGKGFLTKVEVGQAVKTGELLVDVDLDVIKEAGLDTVIPVVVANSDAYEQIKPMQMGEKKAGEAVLCCISK